MMNDEQCFSRIRTFLVSLGLSFPSLTSSRSSSFDHLVKGSLNIRCWANASIGLDGEGKRGELAVELKTYVRPKEAAKRICVDNEGL